MTDNQWTEYDELADLGDALKAEKGKVVALEQRVEGLEKAIRKMSGIVNSADRLWIANEALAGGEVMEENFDCPHCGQDMKLGANTTEALDALKERAERVQEGEEWDLAEFILRKYKEIFDD